jgi:hypothetical protein
MTMEIVCAHRLGLCLIYLKTLLDGLIVVVCATTCLATIKEAFDNLIFLHEHIEEHGFHVATIQ